MIIQMAEQQAWLLREGEAEVARKLKRESCIVYNYSRLLELWVIERFLLQLVEMKKVYKCRRNAYRGSV